MMLQISFNGERLKEARLFNKKSITQIAEFLNVSKQMVSKYEKGRATPSEESLEILARELKFPRDFFFGNDNFSLTSTGTFFRSRYTATQTEKLPAEINKNYVALIRDYLGKFIDFPHLDWELSGLDLTPREYANYIRKQWQLGDKPIDNLSLLMEEKGFVISRIDTQSDKVDAFGSAVKVNNNEYYVVMLEGTDYSFYRQQFSLAHELGHWLMHENSKTPQDMGAIEYKQMEDEANEFAAEFLLPMNSFKQSIIGHENEIEYYRYLKRIWQVSISTMVMRSKSLNIIDSNEYTSLYKKLSYRGWRKHEPLDSTKLISNPLTLKQSVELLVENRIVMDISADIYRIYNKLLPNFLIEKLCNLEEGYLDELDDKYPNIISLNKERFFRGKK